MREESAFYKAVFAGDRDLVREMLDAGADVNERRFDLFTPIMAASYKGHAAVIALLAERGADLDAVDVQLKTVLHCAARSGNPEAVRLLLTMGAPLEARTKSGNKTPLHVAVGEFPKEAIYHTALALLEAGADPDARDDQGNTTLWSAMTRSDAEIVELLLHYGADIEARSNSGSTILIRCSQLLFGTHAIKVLIANGSNVQAQDNEGQTALMHVARSPKRCAVDILLDAGAPVDQQDQRGTTALMHAAGQYISDESRHRYLNGGTSASGRTVPAIWTPGELAAKITKAYAVRSEIIRCLLRRGANPDLRDVHGQMALEIAMATSDTADALNAEVITALSGAA